jgi:hypothetical protein
MTRIAILVALAAMASAKAEPARLGVHLLTAHAQHGYEAVTAGLYVEASNGFTAGVLRNSESRVSFYGGRTWQTDSGRWAITAGGITGYRGAALSPLLVPSVRLHLGPGAAARLSLIPKPPRHGGSSALHLSIERNF